MAALLPVKVIAHILSYLQVKDILSFKCVCKDWYTLITSQDFVKLHLEHQSHLDPSFIVLDKSSMYSVHLNSQHHVANKLNHPPRKIGLRSPCKKLVGSCNGLLCFNLDIYRGLFILYNPATRIVYEVQSFNEKNHKSSVVPVFGYDCKHDDYKIVVFGWKVNIVYVYSLRSNLWRNIGSSYSGPTYFARIVFLKNAFHWVSSRRSIMSFELPSEQYHELPMPKIKVRAAKLVALDGQLHLLNHKCPRIDLWIMKEYGVKYSWTKLFSICSYVFDRGFTEPLPVAYLKGRSQILFAPTEKPDEPVDFMSYEFEARKLNKVEALVGVPRSFRARDHDTYINEEVPITTVRWVESLVPLVGHDHDK